MADLVHEDQQHEADGEGPAEDPGVGHDRDAHGEGDPEELELGDDEEDLELPQGGQAGADRRGGLAQLARQPVGAANVTGASSGGRPWAVRHSSNEAGGGGIWAGGSEPYGGGGPYGGTDGRPVLRSRSASRAFTDVAPVNAAVARRRSR